MFSSSTIFARVMLMLHVKGLSIVWCTFVVALSQAPSDMRATVPVVVGAAVLAVLVVVPAGMRRWTWPSAGAPGDQQDK